MRMDSSACCQDCFFGLLGDFRDGVCLECREGIKARLTDWELSNLRRDVEDGRLMGPVRRLDDGNL